MTTIGYRPSNDAGGCRRCGSFSIWAHRCGAPGDCHVDFYCAQLRSAGRFLRRSGYCCSSDAWCDRAATTRVSLKWLSTEFSATHEESS